MAPANDRESATENRAGVALAIADDPEVAFVNAELNDVPVLLREERLGLPSLVK
jgi:BioD-like phosphotransacetylase family protein